jgi:hypothetical protein
MRSISTVAAGFLTLAAFVAATTPLAAAPPEIPRVLNPPLASDLARPRRCCRIAGSGSHRE